MVPPRLPPRVLSDLQGVGRTFTLSPLLQAKVDLRTSIQILGNPPPVWAHRVYSSSRVGSSTLNAHQEVSQGHGPSHVVARPLPHGVYHLQFPRVHETRTSHRFARHPRTHQSSRSFDRHSQVYLPVPEPGQPLSGQTFRARRPPRPAPQNLP